MYDISNKVAIVIPLYKNVLSVEELISLNRLIFILNSYKHFYVIPEGLNVDFLQNHYKSTSEFSVIRFKMSYFFSTETYNKLMLSSFFYEKFLEFEYILIHQLDSFIFSDKLNYFCKLKYDYIGAPWVDWEWSNYYARKLTFTRRLVSKFGYNNFNLVGNGGFSLRNVNSFIRNLHFFGREALRFKLNEDYFYSFFINSYNPFFRVASFDKALQFSFDENPDMSFRLNNYKLPMACHAWPKYRKFWNDFINVNN